MGGKRKLRIPADLGYGSAGSPPTIPPDSALIFDVELVSIDRFATKRARRALRRECEDLGSNDGESARRFRARPESHR